MIIILIATLIFNGGGAIIFFHFLKSDIKREIAEYIEHELSLDEITALSINHENINNIRWINDEEFIYKGYYYDLIEKEKNGERIILFCYKDKKETEVNNKMIGYLEKSNESNSKKSSKSINILINLYFNKIETINHFFCVYDITYPIIKENAINRFFTIILPPPKL